MKNRLGLRSWATGAVVLAAVTGCASSSSDPGPHAAPRTSSSSPASESSSAPASSPAEAAVVQATSTVHHYFGALDEVRQNRSASISRLSSVMTGIELVTQRRLVRRQRSQNLRQIGNTSIDRLRVHAINLDDSDSAAKVPTVTIDVCWDVTKADLVDRNGTSVVSPSRAPRGWTRYVVANSHLQDHATDGWRVTDGQDLKRTPCAAS